MTGIELVQEEGKKFGFDISDEDADAILWEETGFPCYFMLDEEHPTPEARLRQQVREVLTRAQATKRCAP